MSSSMRQGIQSPKLAKRVATYAVAGAAVTIGGVNMAEADMI